MDNFSHIFWTVTYSSALSSLTFLTDQFHPSLITSIPCPLQQTDWYLRNSSCLWPAAASRLHTFPNLMEEQIFYNHSEKFIGKRCQALKSGMFNPSWLAKAIQKFLTSTVSLATCTLNKKIERLWTWERQKVNINCWIQMKDYCILSHRR